MSITLLEVLFWSALFLVFYAYLGYGLLLWVLMRLGRGRPAVLPDDFLPPLGFITCAYNEEEHIEAKIANSLALDYPRERLQLIFVSDGSTDATAALIDAYPYPEGTRVLHLHDPVRKGKIAAFQRAMEQVQTPFVVSTDANALVNPQAVRRLVAHFADPATGAVAGEKRISLAERDAAHSAGEGIYWRYESLLKKWDAELGSVVGAAGELFAFRTEAYEKVPPDTIIEDFYLTLRIAQKGWRVAYEPCAFAVESASASVAEELKRKIRIAAGGLQAVARLRALLNVFRYGWLSVQYISHRVLRWTLAPALLPLIFLSNLLLAFSGGWLYPALLAGQIAFYAAAWTGYLLEKRHMKVKAFFVPYYFCVMNYAVYAGFLRYCKGSQSVLWEKAKRAQ
ncbi:MAG: glycosyltransferase family 2 protein [Saprospiraceae bacterium]